VIILKNSALQIIHLPLSDIIIGEYQKHFNFLAKRFYLIQNKGKEISHHGKHALINTEQAYVLISGEASFVCYDKHGVKHSFKLERMDNLVVLPKMTWREVELSPGAILLSLASQNFDENDYIKDLELFLAEGE